jgi:hypothetical protein
MQIIDWIKKNKLATLLLLIVGYFLIKNFFGITPLSLVQRTTTGNYGLNSSLDMALPESGVGSTSKIALPSYPSQDYTPQPDVTDRLVIQESNLSLLVKDVVDVRMKIPTLSIERRLHGDCFDH